MLERGSERALTASAGRGTVAGWVLGGPGRWWNDLSPNLAAIRAAAADGHNFIQLQAKVDDVTTAFCRLVDGRVVTMRRAMAQLDRIQGAAAAGDVESRMSAAPFHHGCCTRYVPIRFRTDP